jgi:hypothetical protein
MKILNDLRALFMLLFLLCGGMAYTSYTIMRPLITQNGTSVIAASDPDVKGGKKFTTLLPKDLTLQQLSLLNFARQVAIEDGFKHPEYLQGMIMQESLAGEMKSFRVAGHELGNKMTDLYYGVTQIKLAAAKDVLKRWPELWEFVQTKTEQELVARLILDDHFNIRVGSKYLLLMGINSDKDRGITAYNRGPGGVNDVNDPSSFYYTTKVKQYAQRMKTIGG